VGMSLWRWVLAGVLSSIVLLAACGRGKNPAPAPTGALVSNPAPTAAPARTPASAPSPAAAPAPATTPTSTPTASPTGMLPLAAAPAATPTPAPAPTASPAPTPTPTAGNSGVVGSQLYLLACGRCHGPDAKGRTIGTMVSPPIVGKPKTYLLARIRVTPEAYWNSQMPTFTPPQLSDAEFDEVYQYLLSLGQAPTLAGPAAPSPTPFPGDNLAEGKYLYRLTCGTCHGPDGKGRDVAFTIVPSILGKTKEYLLGSVRQPPPLMIPFTPEELGDADFDKLYQYILTLEEAA